MKFTDDKVKKIDPIKLTQPQKHIQFNPKDSTMKLHTLLNFNPQQDKLQSKVFQIQILFKIDGNKNSIQKDVDVTNFYKKNKQVQTMKITNKPETQLKYRVHILIKQDKQKQANKPLLQPPVNQKNQRGDQRKNEVKSSTQNENTGKSVPKPILINKSLKVIKLQDTPQTDDVDDKQQKQTQKRRRHNTVRILQSDKSDKNEQNKQQKQQKQMIQRKNELKVGQLQKMLNEKNKQTSKINIKYNQLQLKYKDLGVKFQKLNQKYSQLVIQKQKLQCEKDSNCVLNINQNDNKKQKYDKLQKQNKRLRQQQSQMSKGLQIKQNEMKKLMLQIKQREQLNRKNEVKIRQLREQNKQFEQLLYELQNNNTNNNNNKVVSIQQSLKPYKQRIRMLQKQNEDMQQQKNFIQKQIKSKQSEIIQLRMKIKVNQEQNLKHIEQISNKQYQIQKINKRVNELQNQIKFNTKNNNNKNNKNNNKLINQSDQQIQDQQQLSEGQNKFKSQRVIGGNNSNNSLTKLRIENNQLRTKLQIAIKNIQNKQNLLKKFDSFSKQTRKQIQQQLQHFKQQNKQLKQQIQSKSLNNKNQLMGLQSRMQLQKVKKQLQYKIKSQRQLLIYKSQLQSRSKLLQQDVVKSKQSIANILNVIHQFGDQALIQDVNMFLQ